MKTDSSVPEFPRAGRQAGRQTDRQTDRQTRIKENTNIFNPAPPSPKLKIIESNKVTKSPIQFPYSAAMHTVGRLVVAFAFDIPG